MTREIDIQVIMIGLGAATLLLTVAVVLLVIRVNRQARLAVGTAPLRPRDIDLEGMGELRARLERLAADVAGLRVGGDAALRRVGVVRYDAFRDMGGHMSFSVALLDARRTGIVISILNGRDGSRGYAKAVHEGRSSSPLSAEEEAAVSQALDMSRAP